MTKGLTELQQNIFHLAQTRDLSAMTYREIASYVGANHPYSVQQAIERLTDKGMLAKNRVTGALIATGAENSIGSKPLLSIPVLGRVSCGPATELAEGSPSGFISLSPSTAKIRKPEATFALIADGDSMSAARINGKSVESGDFIIVEKRDWGAANDGDYVISRYNDANNLKRLQIDKTHRRVVLHSESKEHLPPIVIAEEDMEYYAIEGVAIDVVKSF